MKKIKVEKYINNEIDESFTVPLVFIHLLNSLLPNEAIKQLELKGIDLEAIRLASKQNIAYQRETTIEENGCLKRIVFTIM